MVGYFLHPRQSPRTRPFLYPQKQSANVPNGLQGVCKRIRKHANTSLERKNAPHLGTGKDSRVRATRDVRSAHTPVEPTNEMKSKEITKGRDVSAEESIKRRSNIPVYPEGGSCEELSGNRGHSSEEQLHRRQRYRKSHGTRGDNTGITQNDERKNQESRKQVSQTSVTTRGTVSREWRMKSRKTKHVGLLSQAPSSEE